MKKAQVILFGILFLFVIGIAAESGAQVGVDVHIGPPPPYRIAAPPQVVVIPGTYVYLVPGIDADIFFYHGSWYRSHNRRWFSSRSYNGPWTYLPPERVPRPLVQLPPDYRSVPPGYHRIPYEDLRKNWAGWERQRYWEKDRDWREGWHAKPEERGGERRMEPGEERHEGGERRGGEERGGGHEEHGRP